MPRNGFQLDLNLCTGCAACVVACAIENELPWGTSWRWVDTFNPERLPGIPVHHLSLACNHCEDAPCADACPAVAYHRDPDTGAVLLDGDKCIGCRYCTWACPYDAPKFDAGAGVVTKCTFCNHRQREGLAPACVNQCPTGALRVGPLSDLDGDVDVQGFPRTGARPSLRFRPLRAGVPRHAPADDADPVGGRDRAHWGALAASLHPSRYDARPVSRGTLPSKASLGTEWPLWFFSLAVSFLAGLMASPAGRSVLSTSFFVGVMVLAAAASTLHLGRQERAWRAVLGWRTSWLSREILLFNAFGLAGAASLLGLLPEWRMAGVSAADTAVALLGFATLYAVDRVYRVTGTPGVERHSARAILTGLLVATVVATPALVWMAVVGYKLLLYGARKHQRAESGEPWRARASTLRVASTLVGAALVAGGTPVASLLLGPGAGAETLLSGAAPVTTLVGLILLALGEMVDRGEFYQELTIPTPARQVRADLMSLVKALE